MKKLILVLLLLPFLGQAQKIKTKKDRVLVDEKEVAIINDKVRDHYELYDLQNVKQFSFDYKALMNGTQMLNNWLLVTSADGKQSTEIPYEVLINSLSGERVMLTLLSQKYGLFDANGFNKEKIEAFFATERESISSKTLQAKASAQNDKAAKQAKIAPYNPFVKADGTVVFGGTSGTQIVGKIQRPGAFSVFGESQVLVNDLDYITVATATVKNMDKVTVKMYDDSQFTYTPTHSITQDYDSAFYTELVGELLFHDFYLGHQAKKYSDDLLQSKIRLAKERSANLYDLPGYVIDEKGVKTEGRITAIMQKLDVNETGDIAVTDAIDTYGKKVSIRYKNEKGSERTKTYSAKEHVRFAVMQKGKEVAYEGMKVKGDAMKKLSNAMSLGFDNSYFYKVIFSENGTSLLVDPIEPDRFVIKLPAAATGQMIDKRNNKNLSAELADYFASCKALSDEIRKGAFDLKEQENLITIIKEYNQCKK